MSGRESPWLVVGILLSLGFWGSALQPAVAISDINPAIDDAMPLLAKFSGQNCTVSADVGLFNQDSAVLEAELTGAPVSAYLIWSGRDRDNQGDGDILLNNQPLVASIANHGESGGGSWWHTYTSDISALVKAQVPDGGLLSFTISGLTIDQNVGGENHGAGLIVIYESDQCDDSEIRLHAGLDSFKRSAPEPIFGPNSAVHCASVDASTESRQVDLQLQLGGIEGAERNSTIWLMTSADSTPPASLIGQEDALSYLDPIGNDPATRQWDRFFASIELPSERTQACVQIESGEPLGASAVLVTFMAQVRGDPAPGAETNSVSGTVWLDNEQASQRGGGETGIPNMVVLLRDAIDRTIYQAFVTGPSGYYKFGGLLEDAYTIDIAEELFSSEWIQTADPDEVLDTETLVRFDSASVMENINFGFAPVTPTGLISGTVWQDVNGNGTREIDTDVGVGEIVVSLWDDEENLLAEQSTGASGIFTFTQLPFAAYRVQIEANSLPANLVQTFEVDGTLDGSVGITLTETITAHRIGFGYGVTGHTSGRIWKDTNGDGLQSDDESGIDNALLLLTDSGGVGRVAATQNGGRYQFDDLPVGSYVLRVVVESIVPGATPTYDIDGVLDGQTALEIEIGTILTDIDFGFDFGVRSQETVSPQFDLTTAGIDLSDGQALLSYLTLMLEKLVDAEAETPDTPQAETPIQDGGDENEAPSPPASDEPGEDGTPDRIDEQDESVDNRDTGDESEGLFEVHLPLIQ